MLDPMQARSPLIGKSCDDDDDDDDDGGGVDNGGGVRCRRDVVVLDITARRWSWSVWCAGTVGFIA